MTGSVPSIVAVVLVTVATLAIGTVTRTTATMLGTDPFTVPTRPEAAR